MDDDDDDGNGKNDNEERKLRAILLSFLNRSGVFVQKDLHFI